MWFPQDLLTYFRSFNEIFNKSVSLVVLWKFSNIFKVLLTFQDFCTPKTTQKVITRSWKRWVIKKIYFYCLKYMLRFLKQLLLKIFCYIWESFWGNVKFLWCVHSKKYHKIIIGPVNGCGILQTCLRCLEYIIRFLIKLLVKLCFENF